MCYNMCWYANTVFRELCLNTYNCLLDELTLDMKGFVTYYANNTRKWVMLNMSLGNITSMTSNHGYTHDFGLRNVIAGANTPLDLIGVRLRGDDNGERQITNNRRARIVLWGVLRRL